VTFEEGLILAKENKMPFIECSAKKNINIDSVFTTLTQKIMERIEADAIDINNHPGIKVGNENKLANILHEKDKEHVSL
jgi:translation initiation factor 2 gamma subunit (eIF-2gamma)